MDGLLIITRKKEGAWSEISQEAKKLAADAMGLLFPCALRQSDLQSCVSLQGNVHHPRLRSRPNQQFSDDFWASRFLPCKVDLLLVPLPGDRTWPKPRASLVGELALFLPNPHVIYYTDRVPFVASSPSALTHSKHTFLVCAAAT